MTGVKKERNVMPRSSSKQREILEFLREFIAENGYSPSVREICAAVGLSSTSSVHHHLTELRRQGYIDMAEGKNRTVTLLTGAENQIPILGVVTAGLPILAVENIEGYIPWEDGTDCFALRVRGESMTGAGILDGDIVVIRRQDTADNGDIVLALLEDEATVKRLYRRRGEVWLMPENDAFSPIDGRFARILGKVTGLMRKY